MYDNNPITLLNLHRLPARVDYHGAAVLLNFEVVAIRALVEMGYLKPAGNLKGAEHKYFCTKTILKLADDEKWVNDATRAVSKYWAEKNGRRKQVDRAKSAVTNRGILLFVLQRVAARSDESAPKR